MDISIEACVARALISANSAIRGAVYWPPVPGNLQNSRSACRLIVAVAISRPTRPAGGRRVKALDQRVRFSDRIPPNDFPTLQCLLHWHLAWPGREVYWWDCEYGAR